MISFIGLVTTSWGTQFYITCIECLILLLIIILITIIEFNTAKLENYVPILSENDSFIDVKAIPEDEVHMRREALKKILNKIMISEQIPPNSMFIPSLKEKDRYSLPDQE